MRWNDLSKPNLTELKMNSSTLTGKTKYPFTLGFEFEVVLPEDFIAEPIDIEDYENSDDFSIDLSPTDYMWDEFLPHDDVTIALYDENGNRNPYELDIMTDMIYDSDGNDYSISQITPEQYSELIQNGNDWLERFNEVYREYYENELSDSYSRYISSDDTSEINFEKLEDYFANEIDSDVTYDDRYHGNITGRGKEWIFEPDGSISPIGVELVSPIFKNFEDAETAIENVSQWFSNYGFETNGSTGFHINIGTFSVDDVDLLKLLLFTGEGHVLDEFDRRGNTYAESNLADLANYLALGKDKDKYKRAIYKLNTMLIDKATKYRFFNFERLINNNYIEFRAVGGDYLTKIPQVMNTLKRVLLALDVSMDEQAHRQEYLKKLTKFIDKDQVDSKGNNQSTIVNQIKDISGIPVNNASPERTLQSIIFNANSVKFDDWTPSLKIAVRDLINKVGISKGIETNFKNLLGDDNSPEVQKFITWIKPLLIKKGLKLEPDEETEEN